MKCPFKYFEKIKETVPSPMPDMPMVEKPPVPPAPKITSKAFVYKLELVFINPHNQVSTLHWTSNMHLDYEEAQKESRFAVAKVCGELNSGDSEFVFIIDTTIKRSACVRFEAKDVETWTWWDNGNITKEVPRPYFGKNLIIDKETGEIKCPQP